MAHEVGVLLKKLCRSENTPDSWSGLGEPITEKCYLLLLTRKAIGERLKRDNANIHIPS